MHLVRLTERAVLFSHLFGNGQTGETSHVFVVVTHLVPRDVALV